MTSEWRAFHPPFTSAALRSRRGLRLVLLFLLSLLSRRRIRRGITCRGRRRCLLLLRRLVFRRSGRRRDAPSPASAFLAQRPASLDHSRSRLRSGLRLHRQRRSLFARYRQAAVAVYPSVYACPPFRCPQASVVRSPSRCSKAELRRSAPPFPAVCLCPCRACPEQSPGQARQLEWSLGFPLEKLFRPAWPCPFPALLPQSRRGWREPPRSEREKFRSSCLCLCLIFVWRNACP